MFLVTVFLVLCNLTGFGFLWCLNYLRLDLDPISQMKAVRKHHELTQLMLGCRLNHGLLNIVHFFPPMCFYLIAALFG